MCIQVHAERNRKMYRWKIKKETTNISKVSIGNLGRSYTELFVLILTFHKDKVVLNFMVLSLKSPR